MAGNEAGAIRAGRAYIELFTSDKALKAGLAGAEKSVMVLGKSVKAIGAGLQDLGMKMGTLGITAGLGIATASKSFGDYEQALASLRANTGMTTEAVGGLSAEVLALSESMGQGPTEIARVMDELAKSGITVEKGLVATTAAVVKFAKVAGLGSEEAANAVTNAMNVFKIDATAAMDAMSRAADASSISIQDVVMSFGQFAMVGKRAGLTIEDTAAAVAMLGNAGIRSSDAGTSLKTMMTMLQKPTETGEKVVKKYGLRFRDATGHMLDMAGIAAELQRGLGGLNSEAQDAALGGLFGSDAIRAGAVVMEKGAAGIQEFKKAMADSLNVSQKFSILMDTLLGSLEKLKAGAQRTSIAIGDVFQGSFDRVIASFSGFLEGIKNVVLANRGLVATFAPLIASTIAAGAAFSTLGIALKLFGVGIGSLLTPLKLAVTLMGVMATPFGVTVIAIGAATAAILKFTHAFGAAKGKTGGFVQYLKTEFGPAFEKARDTLQTTVRAMGELLTRGDLAGAAKVGMQQLQIVYQAGTLAILKIWDDWGNAMIDVLWDMAATLHRIMGEMGSTLVEFATLIASGTNTPLRVAWLQNIEQQRQLLMAQINAQEEAERARRRGRSTKDLKDRTRALQAARDELAKLTEEAKMPPGGDSVGPPKPDVSAIPQKTGDEVGRGLAAALDKVDVKGTFSAIGAQRALGAGDTVSDKLDEQIALQEKELKELVRLNRKATPLVFSS